MEILGLPYLRQDIRLDGIRSLHTKAGQLQPADGDITTMTTNQNLKDYEVTK